MSIQAVSWVLQHSAAKLGARLVLIAIANHADAAGGNSFPSVAQIAAEAHMSDRQVQRAIRTLERQGELAIRPGKGRHGTHLFVIPGIGGDNMSPDKLPGGDKSYKKQAQNVTQTVREPYSVPNGTAQDAPSVDFTKDLFDLGVRVFTARGIPERKARTLIGQGRKNLHDDGRLLAIMLSIDREAPVDPIGYFEAAIKPKPLQGWGAPGLA